MSARKDQAIALWQAGVDAVDGYAATAAALPDLPPDRILAVGKAAGAMARAALDRYGAIPTLVVTKDGHGDDLPDHVTLIEASHPVPDTRSLAGGRALSEAVEAMAAGSHLLLLVSGGASSLAEDLTKGKTLDDLTTLNQRLLAEGLDIGAMNIQRRHLSRVKGGGLLSGFKGGCVDMLAISDVPKDDVAVIGSGIGSAPDGAAFDYRPRIVASNSHARAAAVALAEQQGLTVLDTAETLYADVSELARALGPRLRAMPSGVIILGGEPTVILPEAPGDGGRNQALALELAREIAGIGDITIVVAGTDGSDGPTGAAGGIVDGGTWGPGAAEALLRADSGSYLESKDARLTTGPTGTNVVDLLIALRA